MAIGGITEIAGFVCLRVHRSAVNKVVRLPEGYWMDWGGEYSLFLEAKQQLMIIGPIAILLIFMILFALYGNFKFPVTIAIGVIMTEPVGALIALKLTHTPFSVSSVLRLLALLGVSVETAVILVSYINKLRLEGKDIRSATYEALSAALAPHHDDGSGRVSRAASCGAIDRHRVVHSEAVCDCHRGRPGFAAIPRLFCESRAV